MGLISHIFKRSEPKQQDEPQESERPWELMPLGQHDQSTPEAFGQVPIGNHWFTIGDIYDGEKSEGGIGAPRDYVVDHYTLAVRSFQSFLDSDIGQVAIKKFCDWVIGSGLSIDVDPNEYILAAEGINLDESEFVTQVENRYGVYADWKGASHSEEASLHTCAYEVFKESIIGGDCLIIQRVSEKTGMPTIQIVEGKYVTTPLNKWREIEHSEGDKVINGVHVNNKGEHKGYWVSVGNMEHEYVPAKTTNGHYKMAWMVYGQKYRANDVRGLPLTSAVLETIKKLDRYKEATVGSAEERQKIVYQITRDSSSNGEPVSTGVAALKRTESVNVNRDGFVQQNQFVSQTTQKVALDLPVGTELKQLDSDNELNFEKFMIPNLRLICAAIGIPMEVALSWYDSNYSASRAALKDWEHKLNIERKKFADQFYKLNYVVWFDLNVFKGKINAPGYELKLNEGDYMSVCAYQNCSFRGANIPHIDPLKEVKAVRAKLGDDKLPLITAQQAIDDLNGSKKSYHATIAKRAQEQKEAEELGVNSKDEPNE